MGHRFEMSGTPRPLRGSVALPAWFAPESARDRKAAADRQEITAGARQRRRARKAERRNRKAGRR